MADKIKIVTHSSGFHTDDVFAVATLSLLLGEENISITRSRDTSITDQADYLVDFGSVYDPSIKRFDHHQKGGAGKRENDIPYASFGLVWKEYGEKICSNKIVADKVDQFLVQPIDAHDNGVKILETKIENVYPVDIGSIVHLFEPTWKEDSSIDEAFITLVSYARVLIKRVIVCMEADVEAERLVLKAYNEAEDKRLIILDNKRYPWLGFLNKFPEPLFVVYENKQDNTWSMKGVRNDIFSYDYKKILPESWAGKRDEELDKVTGVPGCVFCHNARFMAVNKTKEGILKMAEIALNA